MWEIYAYQNLESLTGIFNAVAAIMGSGTYLSAIAAVAFVGFIVAAAAYAFAPQKLQGWYWILTVVLVYSILFVPKSTVQIIDKTGGAPPRVVANVPFGMAMLGSLTSSIGNTITELFETAFQTIPGPGQLSADFTYQQNGLLFGNRMIRASRSVSISDPFIRTDLVNFIANCTMYDLADGTLSPAAFSTSDNLWPVMASTNPARFTILTTAGGVTTVPCVDAYASLDARLPSVVNFIQSQLAFELNPTLTPALALSAIATQIPQAYIRNQIAASSSTAADLIRQNALINAINDTSQIVGQRVNDPSAMILGLGRAQAVSQQNASWLNGAKIAEQALPIVRNVVEAISYAVFPLVILLLFLTSGRATVIGFRSYVTVLIWIQLWPPLYAILNYMGLIYAQYDLATAAEIGAGAKALSIATAAPIYSNAVSAEAVVGSMVAVIPFIAWAAVKGMETFGSALVSGVSALQSTVGANTAAAGNVGLGNVTMDQRVVSPSTSNPWVSREQHIGGDWLTSTGAGTTAIEKLTNRGFASRTVSIRVSDQDVEEANRSVETARAEAIAANTERSSALVDVYSKAWTHVRGARSDEAQTRSSIEEISKELSDVERVMTDVQKRTGAGQEQVGRVVLGIGGKIGIGGTIDKNYASTLSDSEQKIIDAMTAEQRSAVKRFADRTSRDKSFVTTIASDAREASDISARLAETTSRAERSEATYAERTSTAKRLSAARERGEVITIDLAQDPYNTAMFRRYTEAYGGDSAAAFVMIEAELARRALGPTPVFADGTPAFVSEQSLRNRFAESRADQAEELSLDAAGSGNRLVVERNNHQFAAPRNTIHSSEEPLGEVRAQIGSGTQDLETKVKATARKFDTEVAIERSPDGTLSSPKSLVEKSLRQVGQDYRQSFKDVPVLRDLPRNLSELGKDAREKLDDLVEKTKRRQRR